MADGDAVPEPDRTEPATLDPAGVLTRSFDVPTVQPVHPVHRTYELRDVRPVDATPISPPAQPGQAPQPAPAGAHAAEPRSRGLIGALAVLAAAVVVVLDVVAVNLAASGSFVSATTVAFTAIGFSAAAVVAGAVAIVLGRGRIAGIAGFVVGVVANPYLLTRLLEALGGAAVG